MSIDWKKTCFNCGKCCGCIPISAFDFWVKHVTDVQTPPVDILEAEDKQGAFLVMPITKSFNCVFLKKDKSCATYEDRPQVCRDYGVIEDLPCPMKKEKL